MPDNFVYVRCDVMWCTRCRRHRQMPNKRCIQRDKIYIILFRFFSIFFLFVSLLGWTIFVEQTHISIHSFLTHSFLCNEMSTVASPPSWNRHYFEEGKIHITNSHNRRFVIELYHVYVFVSVSVSLLLSITSVCVRLLNMLLALFLLLFMLTFWVFPSQLALPTRHICHIRFFTLSKVTTTTNNIPKNKWYHMRKNDFSATNKIILLQNFLFTPKFG